MVLLASLLFIASLLNTSGSVDAKTASMDSNGLRLRMHLAKSSYSIGEDLRPELSLQNTLATPVTMVFPSSQKFDFFVADRGGKEVYRWSRDKAFLAVISKVTLGPGESIDQQLSWKIQDVPPGDYMVTGETAEFFIGGQRQKLASSPEWIRINEAAVPEFMPGLVVFLSAGVILMTLVFSRSRRKVLSGRSFVLQNDLTALDI
jgi:hypothetical protein